MYSEFLNPATPEPENVISLDALNEAVQGLEVLEIVLIKTARLRDVINRTFDEATSIDRVLPAEKETVFQETVHVYNPDAKYKFALSRSLGAAIPISENEVTETVDIFGIHASSYENPARTRRAKNDQFETDIEIRVAVLQKGEITSGKLHVTSKQVKRNGIGKPNEGERIVTIEVPIDHADCVPSISIKYRSMADNVFIKDRDDDEISEFGKLAELESVLNGMLEISEEAVFVGQR